MASYQNGKEGYGRFDALGPQAGGLPSTSNGHSSPPSAGPSVLQPVPDMQPATEINGTPVPVKKKRKQLVACDSCRLRRVKCDKSEKGADDCSECAKKGINCTDSYVRSKPKVVRTGKLIQQARKMFGAGDATATNGADGAEESPVNGDSKQPMPVTLPGEVRMATMELSLALADHLVQTYLQVFQSQCHVVDWEAFSRNWDAAGRNSDRLSPPNECLALVIQAWAARFSDHPLVLGHDGAATSLPRLDDARNSNGRDFTEIGNRRDKFARSMVDRAIKKLDENGALRKPSAACCSALLLSEFFLTWENSSRDGPHEGRHMLVSTVEHLRSMADFQNYVSDDPEETPRPPEQVSGGTLLWMCYSRDALSSVLIGRAVAMSAEDLATFSDLLAIQPHVNEIMSSVTSDIAPMLSGLAVVSVFRHITTLIRTTAARITGPMAQRSRVDEAAVHEVWHEIDQSKRYGAVFQESVNKVDWGPSPPKSDSWFRDLTVMRAQLTLAIHRNIVDRLEGAEQQQQHRDPGLLGEGLLSNLELLRRLKQESDRKLLDASREFALLTRSLTSPVIFSCALGSEYTKDYLYHLLHMPVWEQGGPREWTWANKVEECQWLIEVLKTAGWCWPNYHLIISKALSILRNSAPPPPPPPHATYHHQPHYPATTSAPPYYSSSPPLQQSKVPIPTTAAPIPTPTTSIEFTDTHLGGNPAFRG